MNGTSSTMMVILALVLLAGLVALRWKSPREYRQGEVYSVQDKKGYQVAKILVVDPNAVHIRLYKNLFSRRPGQIDLRTLSLDTIRDADGFCMGHLPLSQSEFSAWEPVLITRTTVTQDELEGYDVWKHSSGGGVFDSPK
jgi:hypothetical protein